MLRSFLIILLFGASNILMAHQPDVSSTMLMEKEEGKWIVQVRAALTAFEYEVKHNFQDEEFKSPEQFEAMVLRLVRNKMRFAVNGDSIDLKSGFVKLGHETSVVFEIEKQIPNLNEISISQKTFKDINRNKSAFIILKKGSEPQQFVLDKSNDHYMSLEYGDNSFMPKSAVSNASVSHSHTWQYLLVAIAILLIGLVTWRFIINKNTDTLAA